MPTAHFPPASILKKLAVLDPQAPGEIFDLAQEIQKQSHIKAEATQAKKHEEKLSSLKEASHIRSPSFWQSLKRDLSYQNVINGLSYIRLFPPSRPTPRMAMAQTRQKIQEALRDLQFQPNQDETQDWRDTGDYYKQAIRIYMAENNISADQIRLTKEERESLGLATGASGPVRKQQMTAEPGQ